MAHGHPDAVLYPVGMLVDEASLIVERTSQEQAAIALLHQSALATVPSMGVKPSATQKAQLAFRNLIERLTGSNNGA